MRRAAKGHDIRPPVAVHIGGARVFRGHAAVVDDVLFGTNKASQLVNIEVIDIETRKSLGAPVLSKACQ